VWLILLFDEVYRMGENSAIEWTGDTWNVVTGCTKVSPACANCYIERTIPFRTRGRKFIKGHIPLEFHENRIAVPLKKREPTVYFVNSMSDLFHENIPDTFIDRVFAVMALSPQHTFQVLTKRPERMRAYMSTTKGADGVICRVNAAAREIPKGSWWRGAHTSWPWSNVWLGVSVENQHFADERIPLLLDTPAAVRFISAEPLLGPVNLYQHLHVEQGGSNGDWRDRRLGWVIAGGESGPRVRQSDPVWFRSLRDQCVAAGVPFFFKQWGGKTSKSGGRILDGREWSEMPYAVAR
jgi:protein gp37